MFNKVIVDTDDWLIEVTWGGAGAVVAYWKHMGGRRARLPRVAKLYLLAVLEELKARGRMKFGDDALNRCVSDIAHAYTMLGWKGLALLHEFESTPISEVVSRRL